MVVVLSLVITIVIYGRDSSAVRAKKSLSLDSKGLQLKQRDKSSVVFNNRGTNTSFKQQVAATAVGPDLTDTHSAQMNIEGDARFGIASARTHSSEPVAGNTAETGRAIDPAPFTKESSEGVSGDIGLVADAQDYASKKLETVYSKTSGHADQTTAVEQVTANQAKNPYQALYEQPQEIDPEEFAQQRLSNLDSYLRAVESSRP